MMLWQKNLPTFQKRRMKEAQLSQTVVRRLIFVQLIVTHFEVPDGPQKLT